MTCPLGLNTPWNIVCRKSTIPLVGFMAGFMRWALTLILDGLSTGRMAVFGIDEAFLYHLRFVCEVCHIIDIHLTVSGFFPISARYMFIYRYIITVAY